MLCSRLQASASSQQKKTAPALRLALFFRGMCYSELLFFSLIESIHKKIKIFSILLPVRYLLNVNSFLKELFRDMDQAKSGLILKVFIKERVAEIF